MENVAKLDNMIEIFEYNCNTPSNIQPEMRMLHKYALKEEVEHITEFGFGRGKSASAFIVARPRKVISYDIKDAWVLADKYKKLAERLGVEFVYIEQSSIEVEIEPTDLLFIDSWHTYEHKKAELSQHCDKVSQYIIMHDTKTCASTGEDGTKPGFSAAIKEFLKDHKEWVAKEESRLHNGYTVFRRR